MTPTDPPHDPDELSTNRFDPLVPRLIDMPTALPLDGRLDPDVADAAKIFAAPDDPADLPRWRDALVSWRDDARDRLSYRGAAYDEEYARWATDCRSVALVWLWDERLFDVEQSRFTVEEFLERSADFGGFDAIVLWHAYPVIGIDDRNQFDFYLQVPGIADVVARFQRRGVRVFVNYNPWDIGTRRSPRDDAGELAALVAELHVDGVFLDTMKEGGSRLVAALRHADPPQVLEGESRISLAGIEEHHLSWAQWFADSDAPGVLRARWYERRHMLHATRRWNRDHSAELQSSFMNGTGMLVWDAVFGVWVGWNARDRATLRRMLRVQRAFGDVLTTGTWTPLVDVSPPARERGIHVSRFELDGLTLWTMVNRSDEDYTGTVFDTVPAADEFMDLTGGTILTAPSDSVRVPARGLAAVLAVRGTRPPAVDRLLAESAADTGSRDSAFPGRETRRRPAPRSTGSSGDAAGAAAVVRVTGGRRSLPLRYRRRETGMYGDAPYVEEWKPLPPRLHDDREESVDVDVAAVHVAVREVTNGEFARFVRESGYRPAVGNRFLDSWESAAGDGTGPVPPSGPLPRSGTLNDPVTHVSLDDARSYAGWRSARLPTEWEWQLAAGEPGFERGRPLVWNWTESEHTDGITRFAMLKGGSELGAAGSDWYFDAGPREPAFSAKLLLPGLGLDRSAAIGFRLAWDVTP